MEPITLLINLVIIVIVVYIIYLILGYIGLPEPFRKIVYIIVALVIILWLLRLFGLY